MSDSKYDIIIIGTGLGGLVCGYMLAKGGRKVLLLEKNAQIGGCLQTFSRFGLKFDTGMHYVGGLDEGQIMYQFFDQLNLLKDVRLSRLDKEGFDHFSIAGKEYRFAAGYECFVETLSQQFPSYKQDLQTYVQRIRAISESSPLYDLNKAGDSSYLESPYLHSSVNELLSSTTNNQQLQNVLAGNLPLYAGVKDKTPAYVYALISNSYIQSAWRIVGGSDSIAQSLANSIRSFGGEIRTRSEVSKILCDSTKATSIQLTDGEVIEAQHFISDIHPQKLIKLTDSKLIRPVYRERVQQMENTVGNFTLYLKFKENSVPYLNYNYYYYAGEDVWASYHSQQTEPQSFLYMHQCTEEGQQYAQSAEIMVPMDYQEVAKWSGTYTGHRGSEYQEFKQKKAEQVLHLLEQSFPGISSCIEKFETSTPLTYRDYTATTNGSTYGILHDKNAMEQTQISQRTKIPNLILTGQNIHWHGMLGVTVSAMLASKQLTINN
ncbi:MAG: NAD(P)/FAD-dependent oxidoreductase [Bacteroidales bacterium]|nr:NAD(P)/FAD-dependent oxidoreductase [Bacteroidales bacterium]